MVASHTASNNYQTVLANFFVKSLVAVLLFQEDLKI